MASNNDKPPVHATVLRLHNFMGFEDVEIKPGKVTLIRGSNGVGKTTILEGFKAVLKGGHDASLIRQGAESAEVGLVLSDGVEIKKRIGSGDSKTQVTHPEFGKLSKPAAYLESLRDVFAVNPIDFLTAKPEKRVELLLSAIPLVVNPVDISGIPELCKDRPDLSRHALQVLAGIEKDLSDQRRDINRAAKEKRASIEQMTSALPTEATAANAKTVLESVELEYSDFRTNCETAKADIQQKANLLVNAIEDEKRAGLDELNRKRDEEIEEIRGKYGKLSDALRDGVNQRIQILSDAVGKDLEVLANNRAVKVQQFESALATARANSDAFVRAQTARDHIAKMETGAATLEADSETLSNALAELENVRGNLLESLPIKGVTLSDGDVFVDGLPFDRVNESRRMRLAIEVAMLRSGNLPFIVVDGAERLDQSGLHSLANAAVEMGVQMVLGIVSDGPGGEHRPLEVSAIA